MLDGLYVSGALLSSNTLFSVGGDAYMLLDTGFKLLSEIVRGSPTGGEIGSLEEGSYIALRKALDLLGAAPGDHIVAYFRLLDMAILVNKRAASESGLEPKVIAYNTKLKAWTEFTGWNIRAITVFGNSRLLFLDHTGKLCQAWKGSSDGWRLMPPIFGAEYTAFVRYTFSAMQELTRKKTVTAVQGVWDNTTKVCPAYQMVGYRMQDELPPPLVCPPAPGPVYWGDPPSPSPPPPVGPVDPRIAVTSSTLDVRAFSIIDSLTYKIGGVDAGAHGPNTPGAFAFKGVTLDGEVRTMPLFVAFDSNHADGTTPVWSAYVMTLEDEAALGAAVTDERRPPADSVRGWRALNVGMWDTDDGRPAGYTFPVLDFDSAVANRVVGDLLPSQTVSPYAGHTDTMGGITARKGMWLSYGGDFWVIDPAHANLDTDPAVSRLYVLFRPRAEVDTVTGQVAQDFSPIPPGRRGLIHFYFAGDTDGDEADDPPYSRVAGSSLLGRWFSVTKSVTRVGLFGPIMHRWVIGQQITPPTNVPPNMIPADYDNA